MLYLHLKWTFPVSDFFSYLSNQHESNSQPTGHCLDMLCIKTFITLDGSFQVWSVPLHHSTLLWAGLQTHGMIRPWGGHQALQGMWGLASGTGGGAISS